MARTSPFTFIAIAGISALSGTAYGTPPATPLTATTDGEGNMALGTKALFNLQSPYPSPSQITAVGNLALYSNTSGSHNTAVGGRALYSNTTGGINTALGADALYYNTTGGGNTASGNGALTFNTTGNNNTASGLYALHFNIPGNGNSALGTSALLNNAGNFNTALGASALQQNNSGDYGTALGYEALYNSQIGLGNIGIGPFAGKHIFTGQLNIDIGSWGTTDESNTIRIGLPQYHTTTYISGIATTQLTGAQVVVTPSGQLGVLASSERYKTDITPIAGNTEKLSQLRPVSFHLKAEPTGAIQYGLIAEEVDKVYPELVIRDLEGKIQGVRYDELAPMLLSEVQNEHATIVEQSARLAVQDQHAAAQDAEIAQLKAQLAEIRAALIERSTTSERVSQR